MNLNAIVSLFHPIDTNWTMATESKESGAMEVVGGEDVVIEIDEYKEAYDLLEENSSVNATD